MLRYLVDESVHGDIPRAILRRRPDLDVLRVQDAGLTGSDDPAILERAAVEGRVVLTSDVATLVGYAYRRVQTGQAMPGVFVVSQDAPLGRVVEDLLLLAEASLEGEWNAQVRYLPL